MDQFKNFKRSNFLKLTLLLALTSLGTTSVSAEVSNSYTETKQEGHYPDYPQINYGTGTQADTLKRGEYLAKLGDCIACHTKPGVTGKSFSGGYPIKTPFGTIYTPNITPDKETGIGNWTNEQFIRAMREGISPQGKYYFPAFPYPYFNRLPDSDLLAIKAYLDAIPAVNQTNQKNDLIWPISWRFLQLGWRTLFFHNDGPYKPDSSKDNDWNRGAYLVLGLGHCDMCHTESHYFISKKWVMGAPIMKYHLAGAMVEGFYAPNITSTLLKDTSVQTLADVFKKDLMVGGGSVEGPMKEANHNSLKYLTDNDVKSINDYLSSVVSATPPMPSVGNGLEAGKKVYDQYCSGCHLTGAGGAPKVGDTAAWDTLKRLGLNKLYENAINGIDGMPPKGTCMTCTTANIQDAVQYMLSESAPGVTNALGLTPLPPPKPLTLEDGKKIYNQYCQVCHTGNYPGAPVVGNKQQWAPLIDNGVETLIEHSITGYNNMPARGSCSTCNDAQIKAAVIYMIEQSKTKGDYTLWLGM